MAKKKLVQIAKDVDQEEEKKKKAASTSSAAEKAKQTLAQAVKSAIQAEATKQASAPARSVTVPTGNKYTLPSVSTAGPMTAAQQQANGAFNNYFNELLKDFNTYASYGPQQRQELAKGLSSGAIAAPNKGDINNWNDEAALRMSAANAEIIKRLSDAGIFDDPYYALNSNYIGMPTLGYLEGIEEETQKKLEDSLRMDEEDRLYQSNLESTRGAWEQLEAEKNNPYTFDPMYGYAMMEYLQGDRAEPFNYDQWDYEYQMLAPDQRQARLADLEKQWNGLDFDALTGRSYKGYESQTPQLQAQADMLQKEIENRSIIEALESGAMNAADFAEMSKYAGDVLQMGVNDELMYSDPVFFVNNLFTDDFYNATHNSQINWWNRQIEHSESPYLQMGLANAADYEKAVITYYARTGNTEALQQYLNAKSGEWTKRRADTNADFWSTLAQNDKTGWIAWMMARSADVLNYDDKAMQALATLMGNADPNAAYFDEANMKAAIDAANLETLGDIEWLNGFKFGGKNLAQHAYSAGTGAVDSGLSLLLDMLYGGGGKINQALMASQAFSGGLQESAERGLSAAHSFAKSGWDAFVGYMSEKLGVGPEGLTSSSSFRKDFLSEGTEEIVGALGTDIGDELLAQMFGTTSSFEEEVNALALAGSKDPQRDAIYNRLAGYAEAFGYGGIAGGMLGAPGNIATSIDNRATGKALMSEGDAQRLLEIAKTMDANSDVYKIATEIEATTGKGNKMPLGKLGKLTKSLGETLGKQYADITDGVMDDAIRNRLLELGSTPDAAKRNASIIRKIVNGVKLTVTERASAMWDQFAEQVTKEISRQMNATQQNNAAVPGAAAPEGQRTGQKWVKEMHATQIEATGEVKSKQNVSTTVQEAVKNSAGKVRKGANGKAAGKVNATKVYYDDGSVSGEGDIRRFEESEDGKLLMVIEGKDGEAKVDIGSFTQADGEGTAGLLESIKDINDNLHKVSAEEASAMLSSYKAAGGDVARFVESYETLYLRGYSGGTNLDESLPKTDLDGTLANIAVEAGKRQAEADETARKQRASAYKAVEAPTSGWLGKVTSDAQVRGSGDAESLTGALEAMTESQRMTAETAIELGKAIGVNVVLYESDSKNMGRIANGSFDHSTHTVYLDINAGLGSAQDIQAQKDNGTLGYAIMRTMGHELTHYLEAASPEMYAKYKTAVTNALKDAGLDMAVLIREKIDRALAQGKKLSYNGAVAEVIADASEYMLQDSKFTTRLDTTLRGKVKTFVQNFMGKLKKIFSNLTSAHKESAALREVVDGVHRYTGQLQELWDASLQEVLDKGTVGQAEASADQSGEAAEMVEGGVRYSDRNENSPEQTSIKAQIREIQEALNGMDVVASVVAPDLSQMNAKQRKNWVMGALKNSGYKTEVQGFGVVEYGENQIDSSLNYLNSMEEVAAFLCLPRVLKRGIRTRGHENHKGRSFDTVTFAAPVEINGVRGNMAVVVKQIKRNLYKTHRILMPDGSAFSYDNKKTEPTPAVGTPPMREAQETRINSANISIPPSEEYVNPGVQNSLRDQTDTEEFKRWFGNSQVVNEDGTPKVMYHGTATEFWTFEKRKANDALGRRMGLGAGKGKFYLSEYEGVGRAAANSAASLGKGKTPRVMELYVSAQKVMDRVEYDRRLEEAYEKYQGSRPNSAGYDYKARDKAIAEVDKAIRKEGYDGVWDRDSGEMFVYDPTQIKSATDNVGTFDPENTDIRYSLRDLPTDVSVRDYLRELKPTDRMNETEKILLKRYQDTLGKLQEAEKNATEQNEILKTATGDELIKAKNRWQIYRKQADRYARELARAERAEGFAGMLATGQKLVDQYLTGGYTRIADASDELEAEIKGIEKKLKVIGATLQGAEQGQKNAHARGLFDQSELNAAAKQLKDSYASRMSVKEISNRLALAYGEIYATGGEEGAKRFADAAKDLAQDILTSSKYRYRSETLSLIAEEVPVISLTETDKQEIKNAGLTISQYKRGIAPFVKMAEGASDLSSYVSNAEAYGGQIANILGTDTEGNLAMALYNVIQAERTSEQAGTFEGMTEGESISSVMVDIMSANLPMTTDSTTIEYLRKEMLKQAGTSQAAAKAVEGAIQSAKTATKKASSLWHRAVKEVQLSEDVIDYYRALDEQRRLMELAEQKKALSEQLKTDAAKKIHEQVEKQRTEYREREQRAREYRKNREGVEKLRRGIGRKVKRLNTLRVRETDQKHVPQELQHVADMVMQTFTDSSLGRLAFPQAKLDSLARTYNELRLLESDATYYWDDEIEADITNLQALGEAYSALKNREGSVPSMYSLEGVELETEILQGVDAIVSNVMQMIDSTNDAFLTRRNETFSEFANKTGEKLRAHDDHKVLKGWRGKLQNMLDELIVKGNMTPIYFFEHLQNQEMLDVFNELREGQNLYAQIVAEGKAFMESTRAKHNYGAWVNDGKLTMKTGQGHTIELTREEAAEIYAIAKREAANKLYQTEHLLYGGFQYKNIAEKLNEDGKTQQKNTPHQLDKADIARIGEWLTAEQKAYADDLVGFLSTTMADYGNQASMDMYGYKKFTEQYYIPFHTSAEQRFLKGDEGPQGENAGTGRVKNSGFTKKLQHKANQTLLVGGISDTVADHIHKMAAYAAMVQPIENMKRLMNHQVMENDGTSNTIRALIGQKYGQASQDYLMQLLKDANGATMSDHRASKLTDKLIGAFKRGAVMASASVVLQQPTAMVRAMALISPKHFANNPFYRPSKGTWDELMKYSGTAVIKDMGKFDVGMGLTATQYILDENLNAIEAYQRLKAESKTKAKKEAFDRFMNWLTAAPGVADQWTWGLIWKAVKAEQAEMHPEMDKSSEAFLNLCGARFDDVIDHTQVYDSVLTRSDLMRSTNSLHKMATSFMSEPTLSLNMLYDALTGKHTGKQRGAIIGGVVASQVLAGALAALVQAWNDDDDERNWLEKYADRATGNILGNLNPLGMIPYVSDIISIFEGYDVERPDMSVITDIYNYSKKFVSSFENGGPTWKETENFVGTLANLLGIPAKNISREVRRTWNMITKTDWSAPDAFGVGQAVMGNLPGYSVNKTSYYQRITTALIRGETQLAEDYKAYMLASQGVDEDKLTQGIRTAYKDAYEKGGIDKDVAIAFLLENNLVTGETEEKRKQNAFQYVDKWEEGTDGYSAYNTLKEAYKDISFSEIEKAWKELTNNGYTDKQVKDQSRTLLKKLVQDGNLTTGQATQLLKKWCPYAKDSDNTDKPKEWASEK